MARRQDLEYTRNLILIRDLCLSRPVYDPRSRKYDAFAGISDCLKGCLVVLFIIVETPHPDWNLWQFATKNPVC